MPSTDGISLTSPAAALPFTASASDTSPAQFSAKLHACAAHISNCALPLARLSNAAMCFQTQNCIVHVEFGFTQLCANERHHKGIGKQEDELQDAAGASLEVGLRLGSRPCCRQMLLVLTNVICAALALGSSSPRMRA